MQARIISVSIFEPDFLRPFAVGFGAGAVIALFRVIAELARFIG